MLDDMNFFVEGAVPLQSPVLEPLGPLLYLHLLKNSKTNCKFLIDAETHRSVSFSELLNASCSLAQDLRTANYNQNTIIGIFSEDNLEYFQSVIAGFLMGAIVAPINHNHPNFVQYLDIIKPRLIFASRQLWPKLQTVKAHLTTYVEEFIIMDVDKFKTSKMIDSFRPTAIQDLDQTVLIVSSSGTTGTPKTIELTQRNLLMRFSHLSDSRFFPKSTAPLLAVVPLYHVYTLSISLFHLIQQRPIIIFQKFDLDLFLSTVEKYQVDNFFLTPSTAVLLAKTPTLNRYNLTCVKDLMCGSAPLTKIMEVIIKERFNVPTIRQIYGMSEMTGAVLTMPINCQKSGSAGQLLSHLIGKVRDLDTGVNLGPLQVGELCFKGPTLTRGYYGNPRATAKAIDSHGWFATGDLGYYDNDNYFYIMGRIGDVIHCENTKIYPAELEDLLLKHSEISDAAVVGIPNVNSGELPVAFVVKTPQSKLTEAEVVEYVSRHVQPHKTLRGGVIFIGEILKNPIGKILRPQLVQLALNIKNKL